MRPLDHGRTGPAVAVPRHLRAGDRAAAPAALAGRARGRGAAGRARAAHRAARSRWWCRRPPWSSSRSASSARSWSRSAAARGAAPAITWRCTTTGNTPVTATLTAPETDDQLAFAVPQRPDTVEPGDRAELDLRVRVAKVLWFGTPVHWPLRRGHDRRRGRQTPAPAPARRRADPAPGASPVAAGTARRAAGAAAGVAAAGATGRAQRRTRGRRRPGTGDRPSGAAATLDCPPRSPAARTANSSSRKARDRSRVPVPVPAADGRAPAPSRCAPTPASRAPATYVVPDGKVFRITDIVLANHQGDEGVLTIAFGDRTITTIALETFRNQDYHWVTPIDVPGEGHRDRDGELYQAGHARHRAAGAELPPGTQRQRRTARHAA